MTLYGPLAANDSDSDSSRSGTDEPYPIVHWFAVVRGLQVGVRESWYVTPHSIPICSNDILVSGQPPVRSWSMNSDP